MRRALAVLVALGSLVVATAPLYAQSSENYRIHASVLAEGQTASVSETVRVHTATSGQIVAGPSMGVQFGAGAGFVNEQVFDFSAPLTPVANDGTGADIDETTATLSLCANWSIEDPDSGVYDVIAQVGSSPGAADIVPASSVGLASNICYEGPFDRCATYYVTITATNGSSLRSAVSTDGLFIDDPSDLDADGLGDECDPDDDNDEIADIDDSCPRDFNPGQADADGDGIGDACEVVCELHVDVAGGADVDCTTIQDCVASASPGCRILVAPGTYLGNILVTKLLSIEGVQGSAETTFVGVTGAPAVRVDPIGGDSFVRVTGLRIASGSTAVFALSNVEITDSLVQGAATGIYGGEAPSGGAPILHVVRTTIDNSATGVLLDAGKATLQDSIVENNLTGLRVESGKLTVSRSWVRDSQTTGLKINGGRLELSSSLVTDNGTDCVYIDSTGSAAIDFATITNCDYGITLDNPAPDALALTNSIVHGNLTANLTGYDCGQVAYTDTASDCCGVDGNMCLDPLFLAPGNQDYHLPDASPCIDATFPPQEFTGVPNGDREGRSRLLDFDGDGMAHGDMGAYERDNAEQLTPGAVTDLRFSDRDTLAWNADPDTERHNVYRGLLSALDYQYLLDCRGESLTDEFAVDTAAPPSGDGFTFIVSGESSGGQEGTLGVGSFAERSNFTPCP